MIKKLVSILVLTLALNFLAAAGVFGWLVMGGHLSGDKLTAIGAIMFPEPPKVEVAEEEAPVDPTTRPMAELDELLARQSGMTAGEQSEFLQRRFQTQMAQVDRRQRELVDLLRQVELAREQLSRDREELDGQRTALESRAQEQQRLASDQGFQDALALYQSMPSRQAKTIFMDLDDQTVVRLLRAMEPRAATKIVKEFKTPAEQQRIGVVLELIRESGGSLGDSTASTTP